MADLKTRMAQVATTKPAEPFRPTEKLHRHRISLDLEDASYEALKVDAFDKRVALVELLRALVEEWWADPELQTRTYRRLGR